MDGWDIEDLVAHLHRNGLEFRAVPTAEEGPLNLGAYLTTTEKPWERLNCLHASPEFIADWEGTVYCTLTSKGGITPLGPWGDYGLRVGPFLFFGDPELLARIRAALRAPGAPGPSTRPPALEKCPPTFSAD
jgi:hypothetical protein